MSIDMVPFQNVSLSLKDDTEPAPLAWLLDLLQQSLREVMESDTAPLQKANAIARLGSLYLKAYRTTELEKINRDLVKRVTAAEERTAALEAQVARQAERGRNGADAWTASPGAPLSERLMDHLAAVLNGTSTPAEAPQMAAAFPSDGKSRSRHTTQKTRAG
jgi:hypothetical protein